jgi:hypothetical protein
MIGFGTEPLKNTQIVFGLPSMAESSHDNSLHLGQQTNNTPGMKAIEVGHQGYSGLGFKAGQSSGERKTHHAIV